jgi:creatinine amidohydrolase
METDTDRHFIEHMHWDEVARRIGDGAVAILPIGAAAKQHGLHLPLNTDRIQAEWLADRMAQKIDALIWPTLTYGHYPAFVEYAGSSSLSISTFEALVREVAGQILGSGCPKLLVLNTGISTLAPVDRALARLASEHVKHLWIHEGPRYPRVARQLAEQSHGSHADELETSLMLALAIRHGRRLPRARPCSPPCSTISTNRPPRSSRKTPGSTERPRSKARCDESQRRLSLDRCRSPPRRSAG